MDFRIIEKCYHSSDWMDLKHLVHGCRRDPLEVPELGSLGKGISCARWKGLCQRWSQNEWSVQRGRKRGSRLRGVGGGEPKPRRLFLDPPQSGSRAEHKGQLPSLGAPNLENSHLCQRQAVLGGAGRLSSSPGTDLDLHSSENTCKHSEDTQAQCPLPGSLSLTLCLYLSLSLSFFLPVSLSLSLALPHPCSSSPSLSLSFSLSLCLSVSLSLSLSSLFSLSLSLYIYIYANSKKVFCEHR